MDPGGGAGLEPADGQTGLHQIPGKGGGGMLTVGAALVVCLPHKDFSSQAGAGGNDHRPRLIISSQLGIYPGDPSLFPFQSGDFSLMDVEVRGLFQGFLHGHVILLPVGLDPKAVDSGAFAPVEHPALKEGFVRHDSHKPSQGIHLPDQVSLGGASNAGIAGHIGDKIQTDGEEGSPGPQPGGGVGRFDSRVACPDDHHIIAS